MSARFVSKNSRKHSPTVAVLVVAKRLRNAGLAVAGLVASKEDAVSKTSSSPFKFELKSNWSHHGDN